MFKDSQSVFFYRELNQGKDMFAGLKKPAEGKNNTPTRARLLLNLQGMSPKAGQRQSSPLGTKFMNKENQSQMGNLFGQISPLSPSKLNLTPSKLKGLCQSPRGVLDENYQASVTFRSRSPTHRLLQNQKLQLREYESHGQPFPFLNEESQQGLKLLKVKRTSMQASPNMFLHSRTEEDKKERKGQLLDDIIRNCGKKQQLQTGNYDSGLEFRAKSPFFKRNSKADNYSHANPATDQSMRSVRAMCANNHGKQVKYRITDTQNVYCPKCAISLIQKGHKVQEIGTIENIGLDPSALMLISQLSSLKVKLQKKHNRAKAQRNQHSQLYFQELNSIDQYYNSLIRQIQQSRERDKRLVLQSQSDDLEGVNNLILQLEQSLSQIQIATTEIQNKPDILNVMKDTFERNILLLEQLLSVPQAVPEKKMLVVNDPCKVDQFREMIQERFSLRILKEQLPQQNYAQNPQGVAFSFECGFPQEEMKLKEREQPFRDLFGEAAPTQAEQDLGWQQPQADEGCSPNFKKI